MILKIRKQHKNKILRSRTGHCRILRLYHSDANGFDMSSGNKFIGWFWAGLSRSFVGDKIDREPAPCILK